MICGTCTVHLNGVDDVFGHWRRTGCDWRREVWERVVRSRAEGHSGRRILHEAWPDLYPSEPMSEEVKAKLREEGERRRVLERKLRTRYTRKGKP